MKLSVRNDILVNSDKIIETIHMFSNEDSDLSDDNSLSGEEGSPVNRNVQTDCISLNDDNPIPQEKLITKAPVSDLIAVSAEEEDLDLTYPDILTVQFLHGREHRTVVVEMVWSDSPKEWLGGYVNINTMVHCHHAETQTNIRQRDVLSRAVQTLPLCHQYTQTPISKQTQTYRQMPLHNNAFPDSYVIEPRRFSQNINSMVTRIQALVRGWLTRRWFSRAKREMKERNIINVTSRGKVEGMGENGEKIDNNNEENSRNKETFISQQKIRDRAVKSKDPLTNKGGETSNKLKKQRETKNIDTLLANISKARSWTLPSGNTVEVTTPNTGPIMEIVGVLATLMVTTASKERMAHIRTLQKALNSVRPFRDSLPVINPLLQECNVLLQRIESLLSRGTSDASLEGLRKRLEALLLKVVFEVSEIRPHSHSRRIRSAGGLSLV